MATGKKRKSSARVRFARNVLALRLEKQITQERLAELASLHKNYVSSVERGERNVSVDNMEKIAAALGVDVRDMFDVADPIEGRVRPTRVRR